MSIVVVVVAVSAFVGLLERSLLCWCVVIVHAHCNLLFILAELRISAISLHLSLFLCCLFPFTASLSISIIEKITFSLALSTFLSACELSRIVVYFHFGFVHYHVPAFFIHSFDGIWSRFAYVDTHSPIICMCTLFKFRKHMISRRCCVWSHTRNTIFRSITRRNKYTSRNSQQHMYLICSRILLYREHVLYANKQCCWVREKRATRKTSTIINNGNGTLNMVWEKVTAKQ